MNQPRFVRNAVVDTLPLLLPCLPERLKSKAPSNDDDPTAVANISPSPFPMLPLGLENYLDRKL